MTTGAVYTTTSPVAVTNYVSGGSQAFRNVGETVTYTTGGPTTYVTGGPATYTTGYAGGNAYSGGSGYGETVTYVNGPVPVGGETVTYTTSGGPAVYGSQVRGAGETVTYTTTTTGPVYETYTNGGYVTGGSGVRNVAY